MPEIYERQETKDIAKSRSWLNYLAKLAVGNKELHVVLTLTKSVAFIKEKPKTFPTAKYGSEDIFTRKYFRPDKQHLALKKAEHLAKPAKKRHTELKANIRKIRRSCKQRFSEGHGPNVCHFEYEKDRFDTAADDFLSDLGNDPLAPTHPLVQSRARALIKTPAQKRKREKQLVKQAFRPFTENELKKIRAFKTWKANESKRLEDRAEFYNHQAEFWTKRSRKEGPVACYHKVKVRKYEGLYGEPYFYNRRDIFIPKQAFCDRLPEPFHEV